MAAQVSVAEIAQSIAKHLRLLSGQGIAGFDCSQETRTLLKQGFHQKGSGPKAIGVGLEAEALSCTDCPLHKERINGVFAQGDPGAALMLAGIAPGMEESKAGLPFQGEVGGLLDNILKAMGMTRDDVYLCNLVKCPVPDGELPDPMCLRACSRFFRKQVEAVRPQVICAFGQITAEAILKQDLPYSRVRGQLQPYLGMRVMPTFHPRELLTAPQKKRAVWQDMQAIMRAIGKPLS
ncbi:uracil-DNA glycosylase [Desulfatibacillum aliphaticivorans]|uniref:uracil-DNA glycosylase n=1 Tax=Desulfatibacillum aliphaticivorans TaxID=218208 RepID=UPI00041D8A49|nr:uracil-DNA glycosylase [Desulfatibacillum aliphaticivorans]